MAEETEFVRAIVKATGGEVTFHRSTVEAEPDLYEVIDRPAVDASGAPLPSKPRVSKGGAPKSPAEKADSSRNQSEPKAGTPADNPKE